MQQASDIGWIAFGIAVLGLFGWYFWHTATTMLAYMRSVVHLLDTSSERLRQRLEHEAKYGRKPLWYRFMQKLIVATVIAGAAALVWTRFRGR